MPTECSAERFDFGTVEGRAVEAAFDGGLVTSDAGALLLGATDRAIGLMDRFAACFHDERRAGLDRARGGDAGRSAGVRDRARLRGPQRPRRAAPRSDDGGAGGQACGAARGLRAGGRQVDAQPAGAEPSWNRRAITRSATIRRRSRTCWSICSWRRTTRPPQQIILDLDATDDPLHGEQEGRFFHGYYDCYCYLPLYVFCGRHLLAAKLRRADIDAAAGAVEEVARIVAQIRARWPRVRILLRADSGFAREDADGVVRGERRGLPVRAGPQRAAGRRDRRASLTRPTATSRAHRPAGAPLQGLQVDDARQLEPPAPRRRQGRVDARARPIRASSSPRCGATRARPGISTRRSTAPAARWRTGSRSASSISTPTAPRPPRCAPTSCGCGSPRWPMCCSAPCAASACTTPTSPTPPAAPSASSCSRSARWCASASAASRSPWPRPVRPPMTGAAPRSASQSPPWPAPRPPDTRRRGAIIARHNPQAHGDPKNVTDKPRTSAPRHPARLRPSSRQNRLTALPNPSVV